ncbi:hypothetical protein C3L33_12335, partial [Rhododendron williamsianum]
MERGRFCRLCVDFRMAVSTLMSMIGIPSCSPQRLHSFPTAISDPAHDENVATFAQRQNKKLDNARDLFIKLSSKGLQPDFITYDIMIRGLRKEGFFDEAKELSVKMEQNGFLPDIGDYKSII